MHKGELLRIKIENTGMSISSVADKLSRQRRTLYNWFKKPDLDDEILFEVGEVIGVDFVAILRSMEAKEQDEKNVLPPPIEGDLQSMCNYYQAMYLRTKEELVITKQKLFELKNRNEEESVQVVLRAFRTTNHLNRSLVSKLGHLTDSLQIVAEHLGKGQ